MIPTISRIVMISAISMAGIMFWDFMFLIIIIVIRYLLSLENWLELLLLSLLAFLLLAPDDLQDCSCQVGGHHVQEDHDHCELVILTSIMIVKMKQL